MNETKELQFLNVEIFIGTRNRKDAVASKMLVKCCFISNVFMGGFFV